MRAIYLILSKLSEDVHYPPNLSSPFPYAEQHVVEEAAYEVE
uniref:Uncharacterized protein n=1 Tax=Aegilops tauschii subsp. strangulata TaxID=200361 RepID=A0A453QPX3_AEGTS